jgi:hypothetical protein
MSELEAQLRAYGLVLDRAAPVVADIGETMSRRIRRSYVVALAVVIVVATAASVIAVEATRSGDAGPPRIVTPGPTLPTPTPSSTPVASGVLAIGDSVMQGAKGSLESTIPGIAVDAVKSRQFFQEVNVVQVYKAASALPAVIVIHLGTNGRVTNELFDRTMQTIGRGHTVYFVTARVPRLWETEVNNTLRAGVARWPGARLIDWHGYSNSHDDWFVADGFHLTAAGRRAYSLFLAAAIGRVPAPTSTIR